MILRVQNLVLAALFALFALFWAQSFVSQNPISGGYQFFEEAASRDFAHNPLNDLEKFAPSPKTAPECCNAPKGTPQIRLNQASGNKFEQEVLDITSPSGGVKNTASYTTTIDGKTVTTIPDQWGAGSGGILEAKNVQSLSYSPQLRAQVDLAQSTGQPMNLAVSPRTNYVSGPLRTGVESTGGKVYVYDPITKTLTEW